MTVSDALRAHACRVLGHDDPADLNLPGCPISDEQLVEQLVGRIEAVAALVDEGPLPGGPLVSLAEVLADAAGDDPAVGRDLADLDEQHPDEPDERVLARYVVAQLARRGWALVRVAR